MTDPAWKRVMEAIARQHPMHADRAESWLAEQLAISVQAVHNWKTRGLPAKQHADIAAALGWTVDQLLGLVAPPQDPWPFETVARERFDRLSEREKGMVELAMLTALERIEGRGH